MESKNQEIKPLSREFKKKYESYQGHLQKANEIEEKLDNTEVTIGQENDQVATAINKRDEHIRATGKLLKDLNLQISGENKEGSLLDFPVTEGDSLVKHRSFFSDKTGGVKRNEKIEGLKEKIPPVPREKISNN